MQLDKNQPPTWEAKAHVGSTSRAAFKNIETFIAYERGSIGAIHAPREKAWLLPGFAPFVMALHTLMLLHPWAMDMRRREWYG